MYIHIIRIHRKREINFKQTAAKTSVNELESVRMQKASSIVSHRGGRRNMSHF